MSDPKLGGFLVLVPDGGSPEGKQDHDGSKFVRANDPTKHLQSLDPMESRGEEEEKEKGGIGQAEYFANPSREDQDTSLFHRAARPPFSPNTQSGKHSQPPECPRVD